MSVLFEAVLAVKLRNAYEPLVLRPADTVSRERMLDFAGVPDWLRPRQLCLTLPDEDQGFVVCAKAAVLATPADSQDDGWWPDRARVVAALRPEPDRS